MKILYWNVRILGGHHRKRSKGRLGQELSKEVTMDQLDFLFMQEHRLKAWEVLWLAGYGATQNQWGVCMAVKGTSNSCVLNKVVIAPRRAHLVQLETNGQQ